MRLSTYFLPTLKETPSDAKVPSHQLMLRAGMIRQLTSGVYNWLPLGLRVLKKIENIVREEMDAAGAQEVFLPMVQPAELWQETGRWDKMEEGLMLKLKDRHDHNACLGPTHEEVITDIFRKNIKSYRQLPLNLYQIQTKFRDEFRPRFGLMRGREFMMKDAYSFDIDKEKSMDAYEIMRQAYHKIFTRMGLDYRQVAADSGDIGGDKSHEFQVLAETGEDDLIFDKDGDYAVNVEKHDPEKCDVPEDRLEQKKGIEVGHIFYLGTTYSSPMKALVQSDKGEEVTVHMGCYGIGVSRIAAAAIEQCHDENGIIWPTPLAPYQIGLINLRTGNDACDSACEKLYADLQAQGFEVLYDDREEPAGAKFANMDLIGLPWQCIVGPKGLDAGKIEWKNRATGERLELPLGQTPEALSCPKQKAA